MGWAFENNPADYDVIFSFFRNSLYHFVYPLHPIYEDLLPQTM